MAERKPPLILLGSRAGAGRTSTFDDRNLGVGWREPDWLADPALYDGVSLRRCIAYLLDALLTVVVCTLLGLATCTMTVATLGLLSVPAFLLAAPFVHFVLAAATIGGRRGATPGMRAMGLRAIAWTGENPGPLRGILMVALFYATVPATGFLILLFALFDPRGRCLHDHLAGVLVFKAGAVSHL